MGSKKYKGSQAHVEGDLAVGGFTYEGVQTKDDPALTL
jgi:hypothetical protein